MSPLNNLPSSPGRTRTFYFLRGDPSRDRCPSRRYDEYVLCTLLQKIGLLSFMKLSSFHRTSHICSRLGQHLAGVSTKNLLYIPCPDNCLAW